MPTLPHHAAVPDGWPGLAHPDRVPALRAVAELLVTEEQPVLEVLTEVTTVRAARYELDAARATLAGAVDEVSTYRPGRVPHLAAFMPSNVLLYSYVLYLLVPALYVDRLSFRPASQAREQALALHRLLNRVHRLPVTAAPVEQRTFLREAIGAADVIVFTGNYQNAEEIRSQVHRDQLFLYLGSGVNPFVVAPGADLETAVRDAVRIRLLNSGQDCLAPDVFVVHRQDLGGFLELLIARLSSLQFGPTRDPDADYGPIVSDRTLERATAYLLRHRDRIIHGGGVDVHRGWIEPTVLRCDLDREVGRAEVFAPIFNVVGYDREDALIQTLTSGVFAERAMGASVYGSAPRLVAALTERHMVTVDETLLAADDGNAPFGGRGPMANYIAHAGRRHAEPILVSRAVAEHLRPGRAGPRPTPALAGPTVRLAARR